MADFLAEGGHWYQSDGTPLYEIEKAKGGGLRPTTLRDAKKLNLFPSVTGIIKEMAAPNLTSWKIRQAVEVAYENPHFATETNTDYANRIIAMAEAPVKEKATLGGEIHWAIEQALCGNEFDVNYTPHVYAVTDYLQSLSAEWVAEQSFAHAGFGGKIDAYSENIVVDFKTKDFTQAKLPKAYENHWMQLGAYRQGLGKPDMRGIIIFISISDPGLIHPVEVTNEELTTGYAMFDCLKQLWCIRRNYNPIAS